MRFLFVLALLAVSTAPTVAAQAPPGTQLNVTTWQQDPGSADICAGCSYRTGQNLNEGTLYYKTLSKTTFGQYCSYGLLDGVARERTRL